MGVVYGKSLNKPVLCERDEVLIARFFKSQFLEFMPVSQSFETASFYYREAVGYTLSATTLKRLKAEGVPAGGGASAVRIEGAAL